jgi:Spy/CpxP family protein refolding chaperone
MKRILLITVLFLSVFSLAQAQRNTGERPSKSDDGGHRMMDPAERIERQTQRLTEALSLNEDQVTKVKGIYTKYAEKHRKAFEEARASGEEIDRDKMHETMKASMTKQDNEIKALLTDEQKVKFEKYIEEREEKMKNRQGGPGQD